MDKSIVCGFFGPPCTLAENEQCRRRMQALSCMYDTSTLQVPILYSGPAHVLLKIVPSIWDLRGPPSNTWLAYLGRISLHPIQNGISIGVVHILFIILLYYL